MKSSIGISTCVVFGVLSACGPTAGPQASGEDGSSQGQTTATATTAAPSTSMATSGPPPPATSQGVDDTGFEDTSPPVADLPDDCSLFDQDCPRGYKCVAWARDGGGAFNATRCVEIVDNPSQPGEPCTVEGGPVSGLDDCDLGAICWDVDPKTSEGHCVSMCEWQSDSPGCPGPCEQCEVTQNAFGVCFTPCDPLLQNCLPGQACYPISDTFSCAPDASGPDAGGIGTPCEFINVCSPGLLCLDLDLVPDCQGGLGCCAPVCPVNGADPCPGLLPGTECTPWFEDGPPQPRRCLADEPGVCVLPS